MTLRFEPYDAIPPWGFSVDPSTVGDGRCHPWTAHRPYSFVEVAYFTLKWNRHHALLNRNCSKQQRVIALRGTTASMLEPCPHVASSRLFFPFTVSGLLYCHEALKTGVSTFQDSSRQPVALVPQSATSKCYEGWVVGSDLGAVARFISHHTQQWRTIMSWVDKIQLDGQRGKGTAEPFS